MEMILLAKIKRKKVIVGNWKMNILPSETRLLADKIAKMCHVSSCEVVICPPYVCIHEAIRYVKSSGIKVGAQNCHWDGTGAFTGEISAEMLEDIGVRYVIVGHSERREHFGENDKTVNMKVKHALSKDMNVIMCVGENADQRHMGREKDIVSDQIIKGLKDVSPKNIESLIIAYEPIWAIGTGKTATVEQANEMCKFIRGCVSKLYGYEAGIKMPIQYGGSVNRSNALDILSQPDIDGVLVGGASLNADDFSYIVSQANKTVEKEG